VLAPAIALERATGFSAIGPQSAPTVRRLAALKPQTLAIMQGPSFCGDCAAALEGLAQDYERRLAGT